MWFWSELLRQKQTRNLSLHRSGEAQIKVNRRGSITMENRVSIVATKLFLQKAGLLLCFRVKPSSAVRCKHPHHNHHLSASAGFPPAFKCTLCHSGRFRVSSPLLPVTERRREGERGRGVWGAEGYVSL